MHIRVREAAADLRRTEHHRTDDHRVYVMDRENHRWQVFTTDGAFVNLQKFVRV